MVAIGTDASGNVGRAAWVGCHGMTDAVTMDKIVSLCKRRGFVFPSSEIYGGLGSSYDYGHYGVLLKDNIKQRWLSAMVQERDDIVALDSSIILHPQVWEASGHVGGFTDPLVDCKFCKKRFRADHLEDSQCGQRPSKRPGETSDCDLTEARHFNLMFETRVGALEETGVPVYLRPETAQGIFINFKNVAQIARRKPPFGIAQVGKSFRNEITPGNFIFRTLEFEQMEMEFFVPPAEAEEWYRYWVQARYDWHRRYGIRESHLRIRPHDADELSHYSSGTSDIEYLFPIGWSELEGVANRGDFDLTAHTNASGTKLEWVEQDGTTRYTPHVIEPALGVNRSMLAFLVDAYDEEVVADRDRTVLRLHPQLAPVKAAVLPLIGKSEDMTEPGAQALRGAARGDLGRVRRRRPDRPALPAPGRDRHARTRSRSTSRRSRTTRSRSASATRSRRSGSRSRGRASTCSTGSRLRGARRRPTPEPRSTASRRVGARRDPPPLGYRRPVCDGWGSCSRVAVPLAAADLFVKATIPTQPWAYHERSIAWLFLSFALLGGMILIAQIPSVLVAPAAGVLAAGILGNSLSAAWNDMEVPNPLLAGGDERLHRVQPRGHLGSDGHPRARPHDRHLADPQPRPPAAVAGLRSTRKAAVRRLFEDEKP